MNNAPQCDSSVNRGNQALQSHENFMQQALVLAGRGVGRTSPNPLVGCVLVHENKIIAEGWHEQYGQPHAEANAITAALRKYTGSIPADTTLYVTLEPCNHHGLTPPCTQAIIDASISHVVFAVCDPNPKAAGGGRYLEEAGVKVTSGVLEAQARFQNRFFLKHQATRQPFVITKTASSLDGKTATRTGHSQWITGTQSRQRAHLLRQAVDAIIVGADTVIADDPSLTVRLPEQLCAASCVRDPLAIILDSGGRVPLDAKLFNQTSTSRQVLVATTPAMPAAHRELLTAKGIELIVIEKNKSGAGVDPAELLNALGERSIQSVMLEGGAKVHGSFRDAGFIDEIWSFIAPVVIGGERAPASFGGIGCDTLEHATVLHHVSTETVGSDLLIRGLTTPVLACGNASPHAITSCDHWAGSDALHASTD
ncbi:MAG: bifunctional diaminohydroxyphosphoribosylaminopyrimidine deaminase/5-amino-6-(5-phosphoribosylamino)uracil reductase RibD [Granulosicoccus sp.]